MASRGLSFPLLAVCTAMGGSASAAPVNFVEVTVKIGDVLYNTLTLDAGGFNPDGRLANRFTIVACDGSVNLALDACDGSVRETIAVAVSATTNPGQTVAVQTTGKSESLDIAVGFFGGIFVGPGVQDLTLWGTYEFERLRDPDLIDFDGNLTARPWSDFAANPDSMLGGRIQGEMRVTHGSDEVGLPQGMVATSGDITSSGALIGFSQLLCPDVGCGERASFVSFSTYNPAGVLRRFKVESTLTAEPGTLPVLPLPATGLLRLGGLAGLGLLRRRRS